MGAVYLATDLNLGTQVAVKENLNASPESERFFRREATLLATLRHPNLPRVTDHFILEGQQYLVMDFVEGEDLRERLGRHGPLPEADVLTWAHQLCLALNYLHSRTPPVVHRDIKPGNVRLAPDGQAVLVDFGIAKAASSEAKTTTAAIALTPGYAPPEQYGMGRTDGRSDQYALAATLYATLTGHTPPDSMERLLHNAELPPARAVRPELSETVSDALARGLALKPDQRFHAILDFDRALRGLPVAEGEATVLGAGAVVAAPSRDPDATRLHADTNPAHTQLQGSPDGGALARVRRTARPAWLLPAVVGAGALGVVLVIGLGALAALAPRGSSATPTTAAAATADDPATPETAATLDTRPTLAAEQTASSVATESVEQTQAAEIAFQATVTTEATATNAASPTVPPPPGRIAFVSNRDGQFYQVYTMRPDGSDIRQLTTDPTNKWSPEWTFGRLDARPAHNLAWSPDGTQLIYAAEVEPGGPVDLWLINADGTNPINLTVPDRTGVPNDNDYQPTWCADGTIAFVSIRNQYPQIFVMSRDDRRPRNYSTVRSNAVEFNPTFFSDCRRMLLISTQNGRGELWRVFPFQEAAEAMWAQFPVSGQYSYRIFLSELPQNNVILDASISPDDLSVAYTRLSPGTLGRNILVASVADSQGLMSFVQLTDSRQDASPRWSPDGSAIIFVSARDGGPPQLYTMTAQGENETNLSQDPEHDYLSPIWNPVQAP
jgi:Tol biopolymer transport system component